MAMMQLRVIFVATFLSLSTLYQLGDATPNVAEIENLARFAVQQHNNNNNNNKQNRLWLVVYYLTLEAIDGGNKRIYEAKIWVKPWINFKQLLEFKLANLISPFRTSHPAFNQEGHRLGWHAVSIHDPKVKDAANYAFKSIAQRSNSLSPYQLLEIVQAKTKVIEDYVKFSLLLKVRRGTKDERFRVEVNNKLGGKFYLSRMEQG